MGIVFFDLETGGLSGKEHPITQIGAVVVDRDLNEIESYERKIKFREENCDPVALEKNHYEEIWCMIWPHYSTNRGHHTTKNGSNYNFTLWSSSLRHYVNHKIKY